jgi:hypothetical protein
MACAQRYILKERALKEAEAQWQRLLSEGWRILIRGGENVNEEHKIMEAEFFLKQLQASTSETVRYNVSAFLSAARSVLQYALEEAKSKSGGVRWYDKEMSQRPIVAFLKAKRDLNIHQRPVPMTMDASIALNATVAMSGTVSRVFIDGRTGEQRPIVDDAAPIVAASPTERAIPPEELVARRYTFADWTGPEDVQTLCDQYLAEIRRIVTDGRARGFLTL